MTDTQFRLLLEMLEAIRLAILATSATAPYIPESNKAAQQVLKDAREEK